MINQNKSALLTALPPADRAEIIELVEATATMPEQAYYLAHYDAVQQYRQIVSQYEEVSAKAENLKKGLAFPAAAGCLMAPFLPLAALGVVGLIGAVLCGGLQDGNGMLLLALLALIVVPGGLFLQGRNYRNQQAASEEMLKQINTIASTVNLDYFAELERRLGTNRAAVQQTYDRAMEQMRLFFGDYTSFLTGVQ